MLVCLPPKALGSDRKIFGSVSAYLTNTDGGDKVLGDRTAEGLLRLVIC
jgi:hypothetical protein